MYNVVSPKIDGAINSIMFALLSYARLIPSRPAKLGTFTWYPIILCIYFQTKSHFRGMTHS